MGELWRQGRIGVSIGVIGFMGELWRQGCIGVFIGFIGVIRFMGELWRQGCIGVFVGCMGWLWGEDSNAQPSDLERKARWLSQWQDGRLQVLVSHGSLAISIARRVRQPPVTITGMPLDSARWISRA